MNTLFSILYLSSFVTPALAPLLYRNRRPSMTAFYRDMTMRVTFRRLYTRLLTLYLITFHFYHLSVFGHPLWLLPSTVITAMLFFPRLCVRILHYLQHRRSSLSAAYHSDVCLYPNCCRSASRCSLHPWPLCSFPSVNYCPR